MTICPNCAINAQWDIYTGLLPPRAEGDKFIFTVTFQCANCNASFSQSFTTDENFAFYIGAGVWSPAKQGNRRSELNNRGNAL